MWDSLSLGRPQAGAQPIVDFIAISQVLIVADQAAAQRAAYGLTPSAPVPRIPGRLPQVQ